MKNNIVFTKTTKMMVSTILMVCLFLANVVTIFAHENRDLSVEQNVDIVKINKVNELKELGVETYINEDGVITLKNVTPQEIKKANYLLSMKTSYPTSWVHNGVYDIYSSKKLRAATKTAFSTVLTTWLSGTTLAPQQAIAVFVASFGTYFFVNSDVEDEYFSVKYYYREMGPGYFDINGNHYGDYEIKKVSRLTLNSNYTGGKTYTQIKESTVTEPTF